MADYILTEDDVIALDSMGFDTRMIGAGYEATPMEIEALTGGVSNAAASGDMSTMMPPPTAAPAAPVVASAPVVAPAPTSMTNTGEGTVAATMPPEELASLQVDTPSSRSPAPAQPAAANNAALMQQMLALQAPKYPSDPYENLSKTQRRMLAFSALSDAGAALAGRQQDSFGALMGRFNDIEDMNRKREAAVLQQQMMSNLLGGGMPSAMGGAGAANTPDALMAKKQQLMNFAIMNPSAAPAIALQVKAIDDQIAKMEGQQSSLVTTNMGIAAVDALLNSPDLDQITGMKGLGNEWLEKVGAAPRYSNLMSYVEQLKGINFLEAYQQLKGGGPITDIEGKQATAARTRLERALRGTPQDLKEALLEARTLFDDARSKNPQYSQGAGGIPDDMLKYIGAGDGI